MIQMFKTSGSGPEHLSSIILGPLVGVPRICHPDVQYPDPRSKIFVVQMFRIPTRGTQTFVVQMFGTSIRGLKNLSSRCSRPLVGARKFVVQMLGTHCRDCEYFSSRCLVPRTEVPNISCTDVWYPGGRGGGPKRPKII